MRGQDTHYPLSYGTYHRFPESVYSFLALQNNEFFEPPGNRRQHILRGYGDQEPQTALQQTKDAPLNRSG